MRAISGNVCRCTGYERIIHAILDAAAGSSGMSARAMAQRRLQTSSASGRVQRSGRARPRHRPHAVLRGRQPHRHAAPEDAPLRAPPRDASVDVDTSAAEQVQGVVQVLTHKDVPNNWLHDPQADPRRPRRRARARRGQGALQGRADRRRGRRRPSAPPARAPPRSRSTYEDLPAVLRRRGGAQARARRSSTTTHGHNYFIYEGHQCRRVRFGDVEQGFAEADHVFE